MIQMKKSDRAIALSVVALILGSVLAGCQMRIEGSNIGTPTTGVDTGTTSGGYGGGGGSEGGSTSPSPSLRISWNGDSQDHNGAAVTWWLPRTETPLGLTAAITNAPADPKVIWSVTGPADAVVVDHYKAELPVSPDTELTIEPGTAYLGTVTITAALEGYPEVKESFTINLLPLLPQASIIANYGIEPLGWSDTSFELEWVENPNAANPDVISDALQNAFVKWREYFARINPQPFKDQNGDRLFDGGEVTAVFADTFEGPTGVQIYEDNIVIHRYWPASAGNPPNETGWNSYMGTLDARAEAYQNAVDEIRGMRAAIEASPFWSDADLQALYNDMGNAVPASDITLTQQEEWTADDIDRKSLTDISIKLATDKGYLYAYYLGYIPCSDDYSYVAPSLYMDDDRY
ncbi:hypothetical protein FACS189483_04220 [Spirochaetia bacterium]|nr:hypothetical protein FACS189483_04220 [Spirochaetia bacterium]